MLTTEGLRSRPQESLDSLCHFLALPRINVTSSADSVAQLLEAVYPQFGPRTGWRLDGDYQTMEPALSAKLRAFFAPYTRALLAYLDEGVRQKVALDWGV